MTDNYYKTLPKKRMAAGALIFNDNNELLIVKPSYKDHWSIPGGVGDENESPRDACVREIKEEIGLNLTDLKFLCVDYNSPEAEKGDSLKFIFFGGVLKSEQIAKIHLAPDEISEYQFLAIDKALPLLNERLKNRIPKCLEAIKNKTAVYLEDGR